RRGPGGDAAEPARMSASVPAATVPAPAETGSIYDIGYRKYDGPRLGRAHAIRSLFFHTLRSSYGIGRGGRAKIAPLILGFLLFIGQVLLATDILKGAAHDLPDLARAIVDAVLTGALLGGVSMAVSAFTPRRAYAVAGIIAVFVIPSIVAGIIVGLGSADVGQ